jgi:hypothetical protein
MEKMEEQRLHSRRGQKQIHDNEEADRRKIEERFPSDIVGPSGKGRS